MKLLLKKATTSKLLQIFVLDSSSTTGAGLAGLVFNSAGLTAYYYREGAASATAITLATMTVGTWASSGFKEVDATNMPGVYQLGIPDAALASGANSVVVMLKGATNMAPVLLEIQLTDADLHDATSLGLSRLDAAVTTRLAPTVAGRTLDVTAAGEAGLDLDNTVGTLGAAEIPNLDAAITTRATPAQVNAEVVDALSVDTYAEPASVPAATVSLASKVGWLFSLARNRVLQTSTTRTLKADNGTTDVATAAVSDDAVTFERSEWV